MRTSGILMHISSLPSRYGIGTFGKEAYRFVDFLRAAGQTYWQILPITPTGLGNSPYSSESAYAINPYFIDLDMLMEDGWLNAADIADISWGSDASKVDFEAVKAGRDKVFKLVYSRFKGHEPLAYADFCAGNAYWLDDYALYMALKADFGGSPFYEWQGDIALHTAEAVAAEGKRLEKAVGYYKMQQYLAADQWFKLKKYANEKGVKLLGDMPIYVACDSADVWSDRQQFLLGKNGRPTSVAGCPPDQFCADGQLWGNPLYDWKYMKSDGYTWWCNRIRYSCSIFDTVRIDHFRAFDEYYSIPADAKTAAKGKWCKGPGMRLFKAVKANLGEVSLIAEDLGFMTDSVRKLLKNSGYAGMAVLQFAFSGCDSEYLPHNHRRNQVVYTGTHDNDTVLGWAKNAPADELKFAKEYLHVGAGDSINWAFIRAAMGSVADTAMIPIQDYCSMGSEARINTPSTVGDNWSWRIDGGCINDWLARIIRECTELYSRLPE